MSHVGNRMIDRWFPCTAVDSSVSSPVGSGKNEKALFPWFASRPIAQARAAVLTALLPDRQDLRPLVERSIREGDRDTLNELAAAIREEHGGELPSVLDPFSGRAIVPLEAARLGVRAVGLDYSPVATLAGRLLADYPLRDWSEERAIPFSPRSEDQLPVGSPRLAADVAGVLKEIDKRVKAVVAGRYPANPDGSYPWGYVWAVTIPCEGCGKRFPLIGSMALRHPYKHTKDLGQSLRLVLRGDKWTTEIVDGPSDQPPTVASQPGKRGKIGRCPFCNRSHPLSTIKAKGFAGEYGDALLAVADNGDGAKKVFRAPRASEVRATSDLKLDSLAPFGIHAAVPDEPIPPGNDDTVRPSAYGALNYGQLMNGRQTLYFVDLARTIREVHAELQRAGLSDDYSQALAAYAAGNLARCVKYATRGARLQTFGNPTGSKQNRVAIGHIYASETKVAYEFDYFEAGLGQGPGTWASLTETLVAPLAKHQRETRGRPARCVRGSAMALPYRDNSVQAIVTDPPYDAMMDYSDASDVMFVWLKRALAEIDPALFDRLGVQEKDEEIIVKRGRTPEDHRTERFYQRGLGKAFSEAKRVLTEEGTLTVVFAHSDPAAWVRLLSALHEAGFVVSSSWPSRTESANTGVSSIKVTVTIGCRLALQSRPVATAAQVDHEAREAVIARVPGWERDGLALPDQLMASYGPAMEIYGRYSEVLQPNGDEAGIERYLVLARAAVRDAHKMKLDTLPLETFDAITRFAVFWMRSYGRMLVPKGEARFSAQADGLSLRDIRAGLLQESKGSFRLTFDAPKPLDGSSPVFDVVRAMAHQWAIGGMDTVAAVLRTAERAPDDEQVWAVVHDLIHHLPESDKDGRRLTAIARNATAIKSQAAAWQSALATGNGSDPAQQQLDLSEVE
jgi:putative DNA methylase